jgi:hypothetical protein
MAVCVAEPGVPTPVRIPERTPAPTVPAPTVLATARAIVERGWLQHAWCVDDRPSRLAGLLAGPPRPEEVERACLVAAITVAAHHGGRLVNVERDAMPWIALAWRCLPGAGGRPVPRGPRATALIRELTVWNDAPHRTQGEVVALLDRADRLARVG